MYALNQDLTQKKVAVVTGGVRGIGKAIAEKFHEKGYLVYAFYSQDIKSAQEVEKTGILPVQVDVSKEDEVAKAFENIPRVDILVNNAGISLFKQIQDTTLSEWEQVFAVNTTGAFLCTRAVVKGMISEGKGLIVNISSVWGEVGGSCESAYSASKAALIGFTKALSKELGYSGIRVASVSPGLIDTRMNDRLSAEEKASICEDIPLGRMGLCEEVANAVCFLEENEYVTGVDIPVNGGFVTV